MSTATAAGGFGLQLGKQGLTLSNVGLTRMWREPSVAITKVTIYACAAADTGGGNSGTIGDGRRFLGEMALHSGATIIASSAVQTYNPESVRRFLPSPIDFGEWEGQVFAFSPDTGAPTPTSPGRMR